VQLKSGGRGITLHFGPTDETKTSPATVWNCSMASPAEVRRQMRDLLCDIIHYFTVRRAWTAKRDMLVMR